ncbi:hypothetical protein SLS60_002112 [Paraconiothyrium brasiliense]|uniref:FAD-binding FR-type domain-containing protein n=1 Tax=Paraconiothyrium brasiliense TaxID=300254 RepID=A0ABR3S189_9PLEO
MAEELAIWLRNAVQSSLDESALAVGATSRANASNPVPDDPGKAPQFRKLAEAVLYGRKVVNTYNLVLLGVLLVFTLWHWAEKLALRKRWRDARRSAKRDESADDTWSSSSSTIEGTASPPDASIKKVDDVDETSPLLSTRSSRQESTVLWKPFHLLRAFLLYQPRPVPIIDKTLPTNAISLLVFAFVTLNLLYNLYGMTYELLYIFSFADRCGLIFSANLPLLYLLAAKTQPLKFLTGYSYESLNIFHRRVGELLCFEAFMHLVGMFIVWFFALRKIGFTLARFILNKLVILGLLAFLSYQVLFITSLGSFRKRMYEVFLTLHIFFQVMGLTFLWFHFHTARPYVGAALAIFLIDRVVFRLWLKATTHLATLAILEDGETILVSTNWDTSTRQSLLMPKSMEHGWKPNDHVFLTVPALSRKHTLQAHPFTIFSAAPTFHTNKEGAHAWFSLLIRAQGNEGFTRQLLDYARSQESANIRLDGPYGSSHALDMLRASDTAVVIAGGSGIAVAYPLLYALLCRTTTPSADIEGGSKRRKTKLLWITHEAAHHSWIPKDKWVELVEWGLEAHTPTATAVVGRPNVHSSLRSMIDGGRTGVVVSGPDGLVRDVRNTVAGLLCAGKDVKVQVEKFGW